MTSTMEDKPIDLDDKLDLQATQSSDMPFDSILNFRDVGKTINEFLGEKKVAEGKIFRSARPDDASSLDRRRLREQYGIKTIIDLRTVTEHANRRKKREGDLKIPALIATNNHLAEPLQIEGVNYEEININGRGFERSLLFRLHPWSLMKLIWLMILGSRMEAISILGREVMEPRGLVGLGKDSLDFCGAEIAQILEVYTDPSNYPILVHCTQGKDRTGLVIALLLFLLDIPIDAIEHDYQMSEEELLPEKESRMAEISSIGLTEEFASCPADWIEKIDGHLKERYAGVQMYLRLIGIKQEDEDRLVNMIKA